MPEIFGTNKLRLYLAFYRRGQVKPGDARFHTTILVLPKEPDMKGKSGRRHHVTNVVVDDGQVQWVYAVHDVQSRTDRLVALLFVGKVTSKSNLDATLKDPDRVVIVQDDPGWRCCHWVWNAINVVCDQGIVKLDEAAKNISPETMWNAGMAFAESVESRSRSENLPICDAMGQEIASSVGPML